jgi:hypothetical protein
MSTQITVTAGCVSPTTTGVERGVDVDFTLELDGKTIEGEVTLLPREDGSPGYASWGQPDHWLDGRTLARLRALDLSHDDYRSILTEIETACAEEVSS